MTASGAAVAALVLFAVYLGAGFGVRTWLQVDPPSIQLDPQPREMPLLISGFGVQSCLTRSGTRSTTSSTPPPPSSVLP